MNRKRVTPRYELLPGFLFTLGVFVIGTSAFAQEQPLFVDSPTAPEPSAGETGAGSSAVIAPEPQQDPVSKRLFGVIPNYRASETLQSYKPLTTAEKYHMAFSDSFDWPNFFLLGGYALESQVAAGGFSHNGGVSGFAKYYARGFSDQIIGSYVVEAILPSLLHEDPRYFRLGNGTFWRRTYYATSRIFVTRMDNGSTRFYVSEIVGNIGVDALTALYYPDSQSALKSAERYGMQLGNDAVSNILTEFWPDVKHRLLLLRHHFK
jgi:hypothetical protein